MGGDQQRLRASRFAPSSTATGQPLRHGPDHVRAIASANGFGLRDRRDSSEWVMRVDAGRGGRAGRQPDRQLGVQHRCDRQDARVADVRLPPGGLVGDHAVGVRLGARAGGRRHGDERQSGRQPRFVVAEGQDVALVRGRGARPPWRCPSTSRRRPGRRSCRGCRTRRARRSRARPTRSPGFGSTPSKMPTSIPPASSDRRTASMTPAERRRRHRSRRTPAGRRRRGRARAAARLPPARSASGRARRCRGERSARVHQAIGTVSVECRAAPSASAGSRRRGTSAPSWPSGLSNIQTSSKSRSSGSSIESGTVRRSPPNDELVERAATAAGTVELVHQRVPAEPWSARTMVARKRSSANGAIRSGVRPVAISSAIPSPPGRDRLEAPRPPAGRDRGSRRRRCRP